MISLRIFAILFPLLATTLYAQSTGSASPRFTQTGVASWYAGEFHGRRTASGEIYDAEALTAAHHTLPFGARVRVTNRENGRTVVVRINDDGPHVKGRVIDLSRAAARALGMLETGTAEVRIERVDNDGPRPATYLDPYFRPADLRGFAIQLRSYADLANLRRQASAFGARGVTPLYIQIATVREVRVYRLIHGSYPERSQAESALKNLREKGISGFVFKIR